MNLYSVKDELADVYSSLFEAVNDAVAIRSVRAGLARSPSARDSKLYHIGEFDTQTGNLKAFGNPVLVSSDLDYIEDVKGVRHA